MTGEGADIRITSGLARGGERELGAGARIYERGGVEDFRRGGDEVFGEARGVARHVVGEHADLFLGTQRHEDEIVRHRIGVLENDAHGLAGFHAEFARGELHLVGDGLHAQGVGIGGVGFFPGGGHGCERGGVGRETRARDGLPEWIVNEHGRRGVAQAAVGDLDGVQTGGELEGDLLLRAVGAVGGGELDAVGGDIEEAVFDAEDGGLGRRRVNECSIRAAGGGGRFPFLFRGVLGEGAGSLADVVLRVSQ